jgi:hypothetical protein
MIKPDSLAIKPPICVLKGIELAALKNEDEAPHSRQNLMRI